MQPQAIVVLVLCALSSVDAINWSVTDPSGSTCAILNAQSVNVKLNIDNGQNGTDAISFAINETRSITGNCNSKSGDEPANLLEVSFFPNGILPKSATEAQEWRLFVWFGKGPEGFSFKLVDYVLETAPSPLFNSTTQNFTKAADAEVDIQASQTNAYKCSTTSLALITQSTIEFKDLNAIGLAKLDSPKFPENQGYDICTLDTRTSDIVPIVVGACLAGLVVVVLVAYLIGRARAKRQGYASV